MTKRAKRRRKQEQEQCAVQQGSKQPEPKGLIGLWMGTTWLACCVQACWGQARQVPQPLDWFAYAGIQVELRCCLVTCMSNAKVIFCVCTLSHALTLAPPEPGSQETADLLVPPEPGREASFACAQPGWGGEPVNQSCEACIWRAWLSCMQQTNQPLEYPSSYPIR